MALFLSKLALPINLDSRMILKVSNGYLDRKQAIFVTT